MQTPKNFWKDYKISKEELISRLQNELYDDIVNEIVEKIKDNFPYMRYTMTLSDIDVMFNNIVAYKAEYNIDNQRHDNKHLIPYRKKDITTIKNYHGDYDKYNKIMEYFAEHIRLRARRSTQIESVLTWYKNHTKKIVKHCINEYHTINAKTIRESVYRLHYECTEFRITHLCALIDLWKPKRILDFSAGRGARLMAALSRPSVELYCGVDPDPAVHNAYDDMIRYVNEYNTTHNKQNISEYRLIQDAFEEVSESQLDPDGKGFDLVFTSPPYFDLEIYSDSPDNTKQSIVQYPNITNWLGKFMFPSIQKAWKLLQNGGRLALAINDPGEFSKESTPKFLDKIVRLCHGLPDAYYEGVIYYSGFEVKRNPKTKKDEEIARSPQPIWIWQKNYRIKNDLNVKSNKEKIEL